MWVKNIATLLKNPLIADHEPPFMFVIPTDISTPPQPGHSLVPSRAGALLALRGALRF